MRDGLYQLKLARFATTARRTHKVRDAWPEFAAHEFWRRKAMFTTHSVPRQRDSFEARRSIEDCLSPARPGGSLESAEDAEKDRGN